MKRRIPMLIAAAALALPAAIPEPIKLEKDGYHLEVLLEGFHCRLPSGSTLTGGFKRKSLLRFAQEDGRVDQVFDSWIRRIPQGSAEATALGKLRADLARLLEGAGEVGSPEAWLQLQNARALLMELDHGLPKAPPPSAAASAESSAVVPAAPSEDAWSFESRPWVLDVTRQGYQCLIGADQRLVGGWGRKAVLLRPGVRSVEILNEASKVAAALKAHRDIGALGALRGLALARLDKLGKDTPTADQTLYLQLKAFLADSKGLVP